MNTREYVQTSVLDTLQDPLAVEYGYGTIFRENLQANAPELTCDPEAGPVDALSYALLNYEASSNERQQAASQAIDGVRDRLIGCASVIGLLDGEEVTAQSEALSTKITEQTAALALAYPAKGSTDELLATITEIVDMTDEQSEASTAVVASVVLDIVKPYMAKRLSELNIYDNAVVTEQLAQLQVDAQLMQKLCGSISKALEFSLKGTTDVSTEEIAERLFRMGPLFVKIGQSLTGIARKSSGPRAPFIGQIGRSLQEGIALPQEEQQAELAASLPTELTFDDVISSASIAHVLRVHDQAGNTYAGKIKRPNIEQAMHDNVRAYTVASDVAREYLTTHAGDSTLASELARMQTILPFVLEVIRRDIEGELDFDREATMQIRAHEALAATPGIHVPRVHESLSSTERIVMDIVPGVRIEDAPANPNHLKNLAIMTGRLWKKGLIHGDMHAGNIKTLPDGSGDIVAYDWGRTIARGPRMMRNMGSFLLAVARKNPEAMAKTYTAIQSPLHEQVNLEDATKVAVDTLQAERNRQSSRERNRLQKVAFETNAIMQSFLITLGIRYQTAMSGDYLALMKSSAALGTIMSDELAKPYYQKRSRKLAAGSKAAWAGMRSVATRT